MKLHIKKSFIIVILMLAVFYDYRRLFLFVLAVFIHELGHLVIAKRYNLKIKSITILPLGTICITDSVAKLTLYQKVVLNNAGVFVNFVAFIVCNFIGNENFYIRSFCQYNILLFIFNILPIYPLDGSKNFLYILGYFKGHLTVSKWLVKTSKFLSVIIIVIGFCFMILNPFDLHIYVMGVYLYKRCSTKLYSELFFDFYKNVSQKNVFNSSYKIRAYYINDNATIKDVLEKISLDNYLMCYFIKNNIITEYNESEILELFFHNGLYEKFIKNT